MEKQITKLEKKLREIQAKKGSKKNKKEKDENNKNIINKEDGKGENIDEYV